MPCHIGAVFKAAGNIAPAHAGPSKGAAVDHVSLGRVFDARVFSAQPSPARCLAQTGRMCAQTGLPAGKYASLDLLRSARLRGVPLRSMPVNSRAVRNAQEPFFQSGPALRMLTAVRAAGVRVALIAVSADAALDGSTCSVQAPCFSFASTLLPGSARVNYACRGPTAQHISGSYGRAIDALSSITAAGLWSSLRTSCGSLSGATCSTAAAENACAWRCCAGTAYVRPIGDSHRFVRMHVTSCHHSLSRPPPQGVRGLAGAAVCLASIRKHAY